MHENDKDLRVLLLWCLPGMIADRPTTVEQLYRFYRMADKYLIDSVKVWLRNCATKLAPKIPVGVYVLSRQLGWKEEAKLAAEESLSRELFELTYESPAFLRDMPALYLQDLLKYHHRCSTMLAKSMSPEGWILDRCVNYGESEILAPFEAMEMDCCRTEGHDIDGGYFVHTRAWRDAFATDCSASLAKVPNHEKIPFPELLCKTTASAAKCPKCGPVAPEELREFYSKAMKELFFIRETWVCYHFVTCISSVSSHWCSVVFLWAEVSPPNLEIHLPRGLFPLLYL